jgi:hypothetical protein
LSSSSCLFVRKKFILVTMGYDVKEWSMSDA